MFDDGQNQFLPSISPQSMMAMQQASQAAAMEQAIHQLLAEQADHTRKQAMNLGAQGAGATAKMALKPTSLQSYSTGGPSTMGPAAIAGKALGTAGVAYSTYQGLSQGQKAVSQMERAVRSGDLDPEQESEFRQQLYHEGVKRSAIGAAQGGISGLSAGGPVGAAVGATLGSLGGTWQSARAYSDQPGAMQGIWRAGVKEVQKNPWELPLVASQMPGQWAAVGARRLFHR